MAEYTAVASQTVATNQNILFTETPVCGSACIVHREGSGLVTIKGTTSQCRARYKVFFNGNISISADGTVGAIALAISVDGEPLGSATMIQTPAAIEELNNVSAEAYIDVPKGCCQSVAVKNISTQSIDVQNANFIVERVC